jgi:hypothetical protein
MRYNLSLLLVLGTVIGHVVAGRTGRGMSLESAEDEPEPAPLEVPVLGPVVAMKDGSDAGVGRTRHRSASVKGVPRRSSGWAVKQRISYSELGADLDTLLAQEDEESSESSGESEESEGENVPVPSPKVGCSQFEFPPTLRAPKAGCARFVTMTMPERLAPRTCTHTVAQEYAWACNFVGNRRCVKDGSASGSWA